jgi:ABC-type Fe3+-hydroxamate transport system substrate-binding protein
VRAALAASLLVLVGSLVTACGERAEPTGTTVRLYPVTVTDANGTRTTLDAAPRRIFAVGKDMAAALKALGVGARTTTGANPRPGDFDLVVAWASNPGARGLSRRAPGSAPGYVAADGTVAEVEHSLADLAVLVGRPLAGRHTVAKMERDVDRVQRRLENKPPVSVFLDKGFSTSVSRSSLQGQMLALAGGRSVVASARGPLDPGQLRRLNPRYYLATSRSGTTLKQLHHDPATRRLSAVRAGRFGIVPDRLLQPGPEIGAGILTIARILHPDAFR